MAYRFKHGERFGDGLERIGVEQLERALGQLDTQPAPSAVHDVRKCIKRLRALLRLVRPGIDKTQFKTMNLRLRDAARNLAFARDSTVLRATIQGLTAKADAGEKAALDRLSAIFDHQSDATIAVDATHLAAARRLLRKCSKSWSDLRLDPDRFAPIGQGLGHVLDRCRSALAAVRESGEDEKARDHAVHDWRKSVQQHWRHMRLLDAAWPDYMAARVAEASELSDLLGAVQDLATFIARIEAFEDGEGKAGGLSRKDRRKLIALARLQQDALLAQAQPRGERLLAEGTSGHVRRLELFWTTAAEIDQQAEIEKQDQKRSEPEKTADGAGDAETAPEAKPQTQLRNAALGKAASRRRSGRPPPPRLGRR